MTHPAYIALRERERAALRALNDCMSEIPAPGMTEHWQRVFSEARAAQLVMCPTCGGKRTRAEGARNHQCADCTARAEHGQTGPS